MITRRVFVRCAAYRRYKIRRNSRRGKTDRPLRLLITASPGKGFEAFFQELDALSSQPEPDMGAVAELLGTYGMTLVDA